MCRIGFIGLNSLSESIIMAIFRAMPETQVFLYPSDCSRVQKLATAFSCWSLDDYQSVSEEAEIIILSPCRCDLSLIFQSLHLTSFHTVISLIPEISVQHLRLFLRHPDCVRMAMMTQVENIKPRLVLTDHKHHLDDFLWRAGFLTVTTSEVQLDFMLQLTEKIPLKS